MGNCTKPIFMAIHRSTSRAETVMTPKEKVEYKQPTPQSPGARIEMENHVLLYCLHFRPKVSVLGEQFSQHGKSSFYRNTTGLRMLK